MQNPVIYLVNKPRHQWSLYSIYIYDHSLVLLAWRGWKSVGSLICVKYRGETKEIYALLNDSQHICIDINLYSYLDIHKTSYELLTIIFMPGAPYCENYYYVLGEDIAVKAPRLLFDRKNLCVFSFCHLL